MPHILFLLRSRSNRYDPQMSTRVRGEATARAELTSFLRERRDRINPREAGLQRPSAQLSPGLSRSQVARLSGISSGWYAQIESGRASGVSSSTLEAIATALRLGVKDRIRLRRLLRSALRSRDSS
jgi:transcriptional regulator with XRE-family HTH domain